MQETLVQFLGQEDPLENGKATHSSILAWDIPWTRSLAGTVHGVAESDTTEHTHMFMCRGQKRAETDIFVLRGLID